MTLSLPALPWEESALAPHISARTVNIHYGKHHAGYLKNLNSLLKESGQGDESLEDIIRSAAGDPERSGLFNNAAQVWNHTFYWQCLKPGGGGTPPETLSRLIERDLGGHEAFIAALTKAALGRFGSGWVWLVLDGAALRIIDTANADNPLALGMTPLLVIDLWEHAYYLDYQNRRKDYIEAIIGNLIDWDAVAERLASG